ncbi:pullulanase [Gracilibacillus phocaeensis]|uniref:pullulanase n=1 Tax=Gracilibacillus phocaeensis TaxID=2042304 RepID=UPI002570E03A|nr:pullulanase [Gracilibacillus phocaeensis]
MKKQKRQYVMVRMMVIVMLFSLFAGIQPISDVQADEITEENVLRIHYDYGDDSVTDIGAWLWGDVTTPSETTGEWPDGVWFEEDKTNDYGAYIDVEVMEEAEEVQLLINNRNGDELTEEITIEILSDQMQEVWLTNDGEVYYYEPMELEDNSIRIHYQTEGESYEPWGVWTWDDVLQPSDEWPTDAHPFSDEQTGPYGAYVDIPLKDNPGSIGFLLVERIENGAQTNDFHFAELDKHRQIFLKADSEEVYTNPYYVSDQVEEEIPEETEGEQDIKVSASVNRAFTYNDHAVLEVNINNQSDLGIRQIYADTSALGGKERLEISPELNEVTLSASYHIEPGEKDIPVTVVDEAGGTYKTSVTATVDAREIGEGRTDWDESIIYFMLTDRFYDGNSANNDPYDLGYQDYDNPRGTYQGGDFKGVTEKLDYLAELGVNTIWITPIVENIGHDVNYNESQGSYFAYHGYWAKNFEELNPHLGTVEEFHELIDAAAARNIDIMADVVLNHPGYGLKSVDALGENAPGGYPTSEDRLRFEDMLRESSGSGDLTTELSGLPDFLTEEAAVREQMVEWQSNWVEKSTTPNGNSLASYRVDTVKHVDDTTWQHFRNELTKKEPEFQLIGESWGAGQSNDHGYLQTGTMNSLLDFEFKGTANNFVNGNLESANQTLIERNQNMDNTSLLGQFLSSHDEDGFLYQLGGDEGKAMIAASLQITAKGQPVIYYGEELGQSGANNWPEYDNRYDFAWNEVEGNEMLAHYQELVSFRNDHSDIMAKGERQQVAGSDEEQFILVERSFQGKSAYVAFNTADTTKQVSLTVDNEETEIVDHYQDQTYEAERNEAGEFEVFIDIPAMGDGGTVLLTANNGNIVDGEEGEEQPEGRDIPDNHLRVHFPGDGADFDGLGLWLWEDVATPSESAGSWPDAALSFEEQNQTEYGRYIDVELAENPNEVGLLINHSNGDNLSGDIFVQMLSPEMNEVWLNKDYEVFYYEPLEKENSLRVNFYQTAESYDPFGLWTWGDVAEPTEDWPDGAHSFADDRQGMKGSYYDLPLTNEAEQIDFLLMNKETEWQSEELSFDQLEQHTQIFVQKDDPMIYTNPYFVSQDGLVSAEVLSDQEIELKYTSVQGFTEAQLLEDITVLTSEEQEVEMNSVTIIEDDNTVLLNGSFDLDQAPFTIQHNGREVIASIGWRLKDNMYGYEGDLGLEVHDSSNATLKVWSPSADNVSVVLYDKDDAKQVIKDDLEMTRSEQGVWEVELNKETTGLDDMIGYYYHFAIEREGETALTLDPYAKSMAAWNSNDAEANIGKAAIVDPSSLGPTLDYASIDGFEKREDAIIYETHVRDFTSDPSIDDELEAQFGTFASFVEKLDYIEDLGVTHIQLLPVMSYFHANEMNKDDRLLDWESTDTNYNWGYDPQSYFSLTGMYSENPEDPEKRIEEFKNLVDEIHKRDMGVVLDVVYNHTAQLHILEDLEPNYYHFMDADGTPRESFGGGRLGTTHQMARRILVDSITYWVDEYKVDGFRFDMMGDHDAESIQMAYDEAKELNPNVVMIGEGWVTYVGDENNPDVQPADQSWMEDTTSVGSFSDDFRNELKSGFGSEGEPRFITGGARDINRIFENLTANPGNFTADDPGDVVPYIAAHDNLTLHDVIAQSIKKDPKDHAEEIHQRIRLGNLMVLTAQGTPFIHAGQEYGRTKQFRHEDFKGEVTEPPYKSTYLTDKDGNPFEYPYFIHDSYDSTDAINQFDWQKATNTEAYPTETTTRDYTKGLIELRRSTDAFRHGTMEDVHDKVSLLDIPEIDNEDLVIAYRSEDSAGKEEYFIFVNADDQTRSLTLSEDLTNGEIIVDQETAGMNVIEEPTGVTLSEHSIEIEPLSAIVIRVAEQDDDSDNEDNTGGDDGSNGEGDSDGHDDSDGDNGTNGNDDPDGDDGSNENDGTESNSNKDIDANNDSKNGSLPDTATSTFNWIITGLLFVLLGFVIVYFELRRKVEKE